MIGIGTVQVNQLHKAWSNAKREAEVDAQKEKTRNRNKVDIVVVVGYVESLREVLLSLLTPRSSSSKKAVWAVKRVPIDMASLERGEEASLPFEEHGERCDP